MRDFEAELGRLNAGGADALTGFQPWAWSDNVQSTIQGALLPAGLHAQATSMFQHPVGSDDQVIDDASDIVKLQG